MTRGQLEVSGVPVFAQSLTAYDSETLEQIIMMNKLKFWTNKVCVFVVCHEDPMPFVTRSQTCS